MSTAKKTTITCEQTGETKEVDCKVDGSPKRPRGWKHIAGSDYSPKGWKKLYETRAFRLPIKWPDTEEERKRLREALRIADQQARVVANWFITRIFQGDQDPWENGKLKKMPNESYYQEAIQRFPVNDEGGYTANLLCAIENRVKRTYIQQRFEIHSGRRSLPSFRSHPYVISGSKLTLYIGDNGEPRVRMNLCRQRFDLALKKSAAGRQSSRYNRAYKELVAALNDGFPVGECQIVQNDKRGNVYFVAVMTVPKRLRNTRREGVLYVNSDQESLLVALNDKDEKLWIYNADQFIGWKRGHLRRLQRRSEDRKFEERPNASFQDRQNAETRNYRNRLDSTIKQITAKVVGYADRRRLATVRVNFKCIDYAPDFDWMTLRSSIKAKCESLNIQFEEASNEK